MLSAVTGVTGVTGVSLSEVCVEVKSELVAPASDLRTNAISEKGLAGFRRRDSLSRHDPNCGV